MADITNPDIDALDTEHLTVRLLSEADLPHIIRVDRAAMGRPREEYYRDRIAAALSSTLRTSLVAEIEGRVVGFVLANVYYGEFGQPDAVAVIDSIGVDPECRGQHVGQTMLRQLVMNLRALRVERIETQISWTHLDLLKFLASQGFQPAPKFCLELQLQDAS